jgi:hypothetical protein
LEAGKSKIERLVSSEGPLAVSLHGRRQKGKSEGERKRETQEDGRKGGQLTYFKDNGINPFSLLSCTHYPS